MPAPECDELRALLTSLTVRVESIERRLSPSPLRREDQAALSRILPALAGALGSECFLAAEAVASDNPALVLVLGGPNARRLGRLLRRGDGVEVVDQVPLGRTRFVEELLIQVRKRHVSWQFALAAHGSIITGA